MRGDQGKKGDRGGGVRIKGNRCWMNQDASVGFFFLSAPGVLFIRAPW